MIELYRFFERVRSDHRIGPVHVSLYLSILSMRMAAKTDFIIAGREELMQRTRISSKTTYYKCLHELDEWGYLLYRPAKEHGKQSRIWIRES